MTTILASIKAWGKSMAVVTIRNLPDETKEALRIQAAYAGVSLEQYLRNILNKVSQQGAKQEMQITEIAAEYFSNAQVENLDLPPRGSRREVPNFDK
ncbi:FitA-like ribbon-helix-helix domain-containing protein [Ningiella sp. W23]|uniref:FitA-like ribbon-helix-helix domain-containing protein n=1 Tax=Ningiella sp. W23 TaxID=3023715 RepID=UPI00375745D4